MRTSIHWAGVVLGTVLTAGCATIMHGSRQDVSIASVPAGAAVTINGQDRGKTPVSVDLPRKDKHLLKIQLPGYLPFEAYLTRKISGWVWGNLVFGGIPGLAVDAIAGGLYKIDPDTVSATLTAGGPTAPAAQASSEAPASAPDREPLVTGHPPARGEDHRSPTAAADEPPAAIVPSAGRVRIVTDPPGADVFIGPTKVGTTGANGFMLELPTGRTVCRIEAAGFQPAERQLIVPEGQPPVGPLAIAVVGIRLEAARP